MTCPFHYYIRRNSQGKGGDNEGAAAGVGADEFPHGVDLVFTHVALVGCDADFLIYPGQPAAFLYVAVHSLVCVAGKGFVVLEKERVFS